jgi:hypothetical protein
MSVETVIDHALSERRGTGRPIYVFTALLFLAAAVIGFGPNSAAILTGEMPRPPPIVHVHAALMLTWLLLFLAQSTLMATGRARLHQTLGVVSFVLAPAMAALMIATTVAAHDNLAQFISPAFARNFVLGSVIGATQFMLLFVWAIRARRTAPETHKRLMVLITAYILGAAMGRMTFLPHNGLMESYNYMPTVYALGLIVPAVLYDIFRFGRVHFAYVGGIATIAASMTLTTLLWDSAWWHQAAGPWLAGG